MTNASEGGGGLIFFTQGRKGKRSLALPQSRQFIVETYPLFASLQRIANDYQDESPIISPQQIQYYNRISSLYRQSILSQLPLIESDLNLSPKMKTNCQQHFATLHHLWSLMEILYLPNDGVGNGVVGEELLDWLNTLDPAPSTEEGTELSTLSSPWQSPTFFPYLTKCLLRGHFQSLIALLSILSQQHPTRTVQEISKRLMELVERFPRSVKFETELEFRNAWRLYQIETSTSSSSSKGLVNSAMEMCDRLKLEQGETIEGQDTLEYVSSFKTLFKILSLSSSSSHSSSGTTTTSSESLEILFDQSESWQECLTSYTLFLHPTCHRSELSRIVEEIVSERFPIDQTLMEERAMVDLLKGDIVGLVKTLTSSSSDSSREDDDEGEDDTMEGREEEEGEVEVNVDDYTWLTTHLVDLLSHLNLPDFDLKLNLPNYNNQRRTITNGEEAEEEEGEDQESLGPREHFLINYANLLISLDTSLWRVASEYWSECGEMGKGEIRKWLGGEGGGEGESGGIDLFDEEEEEDDEVRGRVEEGGMEVDGTAEKTSTINAEKKKEGSRKVEEVLRVLGDLGMENEVRKVCQTYAESLISKKRFGEAISFCVRANDAKRVDRIAAIILDEYVDQGQETFISHVDSLPTSLLRPTSDPSSPTSPTSTSTEMFDQQPTSSSAAGQFPSISFLSRYRDFLALYTLSSSSTSTNSLTNQDSLEEEKYRLKRQAAELLVLLLTSGIAPKRFWAVMLLDAVGLLETQPPIVSLSETYELLRIVEELTAPIQLSSSSSPSSTSPPVYVDIFGDLDMLSRLLSSSTSPSQGKEKKEESGGGVEKALNQLEVVRGSLARHLAVCCCL